MLLGEHLTRISRDLNEPDNAFPLSTFTRDEVIGYSMRAEKEFVTLSGGFTADVSVTLPAGSGVMVQRPSNVNNVTRVSFDGRNLDRQSLADFDKDDRLWRQHTNGKPTMYHEDRLPWGWIELNKIPPAGGVVRFFGDMAFTPYLLDSQTGSAAVTDAQQMHFSDYWEPYIRWRTLGHCYQKESDDMDTIRGRYCAKRFMLGVALARYIMKGVEGTVEFTGGLPE